MKGKTLPPRPLRRAAAGASARAHARDRRLVTAALLLIVTVLALLPLSIAPNGRLHWSYPLSMLCLLLAAGAGYALLGGASPSPEEAEPRLWPDRLLLPAVFLVAVLVYLPTLFLGFLSDDYVITAHVAEAKSPLSFFAFHQAARLYRALHFTSWWGQYHLWGYAPLGYHAVSLLLHSLNAVLVYLLGRRVMNRRAPALVAALLFAVHPLHTESVAWVSGQVDLLATLLSLLSLYCLDRFLHAPRTRPLLLVAAGLCFALAVLTKESAAALPLVAVLWTLLRVEKERRRAVWPVAVAFGAVLLGYVGVRLVSLGTLAGASVPFGFWNTVFPTAPLRQLYAFFFPLNTGLFASLPGTGRLGLQLAALLFLGAVLFTSARDALALPGRRLGLYLGYAVLMTAPVWILPTPSPDLENSRYAYLPTIGLAWLLGEIAFGAHTARPRRRLPFAALGAAAVLCLWYLTPWFQAQAIAAHTLSAAVRMVETAPRAEQEPVFFVQGLTETVRGAQVFRNGLPVALTRALGRPVLVQTVGPDGGSLPQEALALSQLQPGEYVYAWDAGRREMLLVTNGDTVTGGRP